MNRALLLLLFTMTCAASAVAQAPPDAPSGAQAPAAVGKEAGPITMEVNRLEKARAGGTFRLVLGVTVLADHEELTVRAWGGAGVGLDGPQVLDGGSGPEGRNIEMVLTGTWTGGGIPRVYVTAAARPKGAGRPGVGRLSVDVSENGYQPVSRGRLDPEAGVVVFEVE